MEGYAGPSSYVDAGPTVRYISGTEPGVLDPRQPQRLLRHPTSRLLFASFDPRTASTFDLSKLSLKDELYRPKRVVIEMAATGACSWRFVPKAKRGPGVQDDEGQWPRVIEICGELVHCTEDQWEIYKLDPYYECTVHVSPALTTIMPASQGSSNTAEDKIFSKRRVNTEDHSAAARPSKRFRADENDEMDDTEESNHRPEQRRAPSRARSRSVGREAKRLRPGFEQLRRRQKVSQRMQDEQDPDEVMGDWVPPTYQPSDATKRKVSGRDSQTRERSRSPPADDDHEDEDGARRTYERTHASKRARTTSPQSARRVVESRHVQRERLKKAKREAELKARAQQKHKEFLSNAFGGTMPDINYANGFATNEAHDDSDDEDDDLPEIDELDEDEDAELNVDEEPGDEEAAHRAALEESRRKLAELEKDRPLWEEQARKRAQSEHPDTTRVRAAEDAQRAAAEAQRQREAEARRAREAAEREEQQRQQQEAARRAEERRQRQRRFAYGPWSTARALERYRALAEDFDKTKFAADTPLGFEDVPWPVLHSPVNFTIEDVDWAAVEAFFMAVRPSMRAQDYKTFVQKSHLRFHPDRWRSRGLLKAVLDDTERECLDVAANTVAQALTPIWSELKGR
ncbi:hypothetical protein BD626DRAFT_391274 [Schizophyllum amplum]|uniref:Uncharacterized protein n=1 Tax=Schizophyllum amplum TaxID=97359 RepID=A0A550CZ58_9AGAR|nr:hypothetical protein BD626DRAFT_391274 [Auriculariopsis ampla]